MARNGSNYKSIHGQSKALIFDVPQIFMQTPNSCFSDLAFGLKRFTFQEPVTLGNKKNAEMDSRTSMHSKMPVLRTCCMWPNCHHFLSV